MASEIHERTNYDCTVNSDCGEIQCTLRHNTRKSLNLIINSCDLPPSVDVELHMEGGEIPINKSPTKCISIRSSPVNTARHLIVNLTLLINP